MPGCLPAPARYIFSSARSRHRDHLSPGSTSSSRESRRRTSDRSPAPACTARSLRRTCRRRMRRSLRRTVLPYQACRPPPDAHAFRAHAPPLYTRLCTMENSPAPTEADVYEVLRECYDPEIPVNLVDLGLIYGVQIADRVVNVTMTLTAPGCQMGMMITQDIQDKLLGIPGCDDASVEIVGSTMDPAHDDRRRQEAAKD